MLRVPAGAEAGNLDKQGYIERHGGDPEPPHCSHPRILKNDTLQRREVRYNIILLGTEMHNLKTILA